MEGNCLFIVVKEVFCGFFEYTGEGYRILVLTTKNGLLKDIDR